MGETTLAERLTRIALRSLRWASVLLALYAAAGFLLLPWLAERQIAALLQSRLEARFSVADIDFNPFSLQLRIEGLDLIDADGWRVVSLGHGFINLQTDSLSRRALSLQEVHLDALHLSVRRYSPTDTNLQRLAQHWTATGTLAEAPAEQALQGEAGLFPLSIADLRLQGASVGLTDNVPAVPYVALVDALDIQIENLTTLPDAAAGQSISLTMGNGSRLDWSGTLSLAPLHSRGEIELRGPYPALVYDYLREQLPVRLSGGWVESRLAYDFALADDGGVALSATDLHLSLSELDVRERSSNALLARLPELALSGGSFDLGARAFGLQSLRLDGVELHPERFEDGQVNFLQLFPASADAPPPPAAIPASAAPWTLRLQDLQLADWQVHVRDRVPATDVALSLALDARLRNLDNTPGTSIDLETTLGLSTGGTLRASGELSVLPALDSSLEVRVDDLALPLLQAYLEPLAAIRLEEGRFALAGNLRSSPGNVFYQGSVGLRDLRIDDALQDEELFRLGELDLQGVSLEMAQETRVSITDLQLREPYARIEIAADGSTNLGALLPAAPTAAEPAESAPSADSGAEESAPLPALEIERFRIEQASADFSDASLPLPFAVLMTGLNGEISAMSTRSSEPARVRLEGQVDEFGLASIDGRLRPLAFAELTELDLQFRNLDVPSLSPYVIKFAGRRIDDGAMDVDLSYTITANQLQGDNALRLRDLVLGDEVPHPEAMDLPLGLAVALLKDRNGVIDLEVPVTGDLGHPEFNYGSVIRTALGNIIRNIVTAPFRFLSSLVGGAEDADIGTLAFRAGRADLAPPEQEKLLTLASALRERPQLSLSLAGVHDAALDTPQLQQQFLDRRVDEVLAQAAAAAVVPAPTRRSVLEGFHREADLRLQGEATVDESLAALQASYMREAADGAPATLDELAYNEALRRALLPVEPVTEADLAALANARAQAVVTQLAATEPELAPRLQVLDAVAVSALPDGWLPLALELIARP